MITKNQLHDYVVKEVFAAIKLNNNEQSICKSGLCM